MVNILNLPGWVVHSVTPPEEEPVVIHAEYTEPPEVCPKCGVTPPTAYLHQYSEQLFNDVPHHGKRAALVVKRRRYKCKDCKGVWTQDLPDMHEHHRATRRLVGWVQTESMRHTFAHVARQSGFDERTVRRIFEEHAEHLRETVRFATPTWLGIDEVHLLKSARCVFGNLKAWTVIEMLPDRRQDRVTRALLNLHHRQKVRLVAIDMARGYLNAVQTALPQATVVIDKFHVVRMASEAMETVRKGVRKGLNSRQRTKLMHDRFKLLRRARDLDDRDRLIMEVWFNTYPELEQAYRLKEAFYDLYDQAMDSQDGKERLDAWRASIPSSMKAPFRKLTTALGNWEPYILNHFDYWATNAPVEAMNGAIKRMQSEGRGYSFEALRAKVLYGKPHKMEKTSIRGRQPDGSYIVGHTMARNVGVPFHEIGGPEYTPPKPIVERLR